MEKTGYHMNCPLCDTNLTEENIKYVTHLTDDEEHLIREALFKCPKCKALIDTIASVPDGDVDRPEEGDIPPMFKVVSTGLLLTCATCHQVLPSTSLKYNEETCDEDHIVSYLEEYKCPCGCRTIMQHHIELDEDLKTTLKYIQEREAE